MVEDRRAARNLMSSKEGIGIGLFYTIIGETRQTFVISLIKPQEKIANYLARRMVQD